MSTTIGKAKIVRLGGKVRSFPCETPKQVPLELQHPAQCWGWYDRKVKECNDCHIADRCEDITKRVISGQVVIPVVPAVQSDDLKAKYKKVLQTIFHTSGEV